MMTNAFDVLMSVKMGDAPLPPSLPEGEYLWAFSGVGETEEGTSKKTGKPYTKIRLNWVCMEPASEDEEFLEKVRAFGQVSGIRRSSSMFKNENFAFQMQKFLEKLGVEPNGESIATLLNTEALGKTAKGRWAATGRQKENGEPVVELTIL